jgi:hypothetical protein
MFLEHLLRIDRPDAREAVWKVMPQVEQCIHALRSNIEATTVGGNATVAVLLHVWSEMAHVSST